MSYFVAGILKIILLEAFVALILIDRLAGDAYPRARKVAFAALSLTMLAAWAEYGRLRGDASTSYVASGLVVVVAAAWAVLHARRRPGVPTGPAARVVLALRRRRWLAPTLAALMVTGWIAVGVSRGSLTLAHPWEQFHFYLGAKYPTELGSFDLYPAVLAADRGTVNVLGGASVARDVHTFVEVSIASLDRAIALAPGRFSPARWAEFQHDWATMARLWPIDWPRAIVDHGNSNSPAWTLFAHPLARLVPLSIAGQSLLGWVDMLLMFGMWLFVLSTFGGKHASAGLLLWAAPPIVFEFTSGSLLRWDWLFALGVAVCFMARERWATAGVFFGYAVASKLFPVFFGVALLIHCLWRLLETRTVPRSPLRFFVAAGLSALAFVVASALLFGVSAWTDYVERIRIAQAEKFYAIQYSLHTVFLQFAAPIRSGTLTFDQVFLFPSTLHRASPSVSIADFRGSFLVAQLAFTALVAVLIRRAKAWQAFALGPLLVLIWLTVNMYYWGMLGLAALGLFARRETAPTVLHVGLHAALMLFYVYQHLNRRLYEGYAVAWLVLAAIIVSAALELSRWRSGGLRA
jgi:hypothetical protein